MEQMRGTNRVIHFEIPASEPRALTEFYSELFGWVFKQVQSPGPEYWTCDTGSNGPGINGAVLQRQSPAQPHLNYVDVASIDSTVDTATKLGATVCIPKLLVSGMGAIAVLMDPQGNLFGLFEQA